MLDFNKFSNSNIINENKVTHNTYKNNSYFLSLVKEMSYTEFFEAIPYLTTMPNRIATVNDNNDFNDDNINNNNNKVNKALLKNI